jgi:hypothetical protein
MLNSSLCAAAQPNYSTGYQHPPLHYQQAPNYTYQPTHEGTRRQL